MQQDDIDLDLAGAVPPPARPAADFWLVSGDGMRVPVAREVSIGRGEDNTIVLAGDRLVSRLHATVRGGDDGLELEDLGSANGKYLNDVRVSGRNPLRVGDEVRIGGTRLRVERVGVGPAVPAPSGEESTIHVEEDASEQTMSALDFDGDLLDLEAPPDPRTAEREGVVVEAGDTPRLTINFGPHAGQTFALEREVIVMGREGGATD